MTEDTEYEYLVRVVDSLDNVGRAEGHTPSGRDRISPGRFKLAWFEYATHTLYVDARDLNTDGYA